MLKVTKKVISYFHQVYLLFYLRWSESYSCESGTVLGDKTDLANHLILCYPGNHGCDQHGRRRNIWLD
jgi:hypothetical protein